ncbi:MAG: alpha/beta fold hydrolase [Candidatus Thiodiazotropha sp.]
MKKTLLILIALVCTTLLSLTLATDDQQAISKTLSRQEIVVLLHGLGRSNTAMWRLASRLEGAGYEVHRVGYSSINTTTDEIITDITQQISDCCANESRPVHFVGHSLGGLLIRSYLQDNPIDNLGRVVLIGTPNSGTGIADQFRGNCLVELLVPVATALGTDETSLPNRLAPPYYPVGVIAGFQKSHTNEAYLPGRDDGLVPVESTKLEGMTDFIEVESGHSMMRYKKEVAEQVIFFLKTGRFNQNQ